MDWQLPSLAIQILKRGIFQMKTTCQEHHHLKNKERSSKADEINRF